MSDLTDAHRVLVVDDEPNIVDVVTMALRFQGFAVAQRLGAQRARVPIIFLTARDDTADKIRGLSIGGDDYVTKPFSLEEVIARIRAVLRRTSAAAPSPSARSRMSFADIELDEDSH